MSDTKVLIGVPCMDSVKTKFAFSLFNLKRPENTELLMKVGADVARNRNEIVRHALENGFTHVLFIDSDMKFNPDTLDEMLRHDADILGVMYHQRALPLRNNFMPLGVKAVEGTSKVIKANVPDGPFEVEWVGTGITLVKTEVFRRIGMPYFAFQYDEYVGEDVYFCRKAKAAGYRILVDAIPNRHIGEFEY